jgi:hypothetical protein
MEGGIFMNKTEQIEYEVLQEFRNGRKTRKQVAMLLGISERAVSRRVKKLRELGIAGIKHGNYSRPPVNKIPEPLKREALALIRDKYFDFNISHAWEKLTEQHGFSKSYMTLLGWCRDEGLVKSKPRRPSKARVYRERMANEGILLQMDGSHHKWNGKDKWCLISLIDDATSNIPAGQFFNGETSWNCMHVLRRLFTEQGIPQFLYTDGAGWAGGGAKRQNFSQVVRACQELGIKIIRANSAQAKGRIERSYRTIQDRLIPEMRLKGIVAMTDANRYLDQVFWPEWNTRFTVEPQESPSRYRALRPEVDLGEILCMKYNRRVCRDHTISFESKRYKLDPKPWSSLRSKTVAIHQYEDGRFKIYYDQQRVSHQEVILPKRRWV